VGGSRQGARRADSKNPRVSTITAYLQAIASLPVRDLRISATSSNGAVEDEPAEIASGYQPKPAPTNGPHAPGPTNGGQPLPPRGGGNPRG
jgi:hypothetical protein